MLRKMLGYGNKHFLRLNGYEILITAIELLHQGKQPFAQFLPMLADGINFIPFYPEDQTYPPPQTCNYYSTLKINSTILMRIIINSSPKSTRSCNNNAHYRRGSGNVGLFL